MRIPAAGYVCRLFAETHCDFELKRVERFDVGKLLFPYCGHLPPFYLFAPDSTRRTRSKINPFTSNRKSPNFLLEGTKKQTGGDLCVLQLSGARILGGSAQAFK